jgi:hypothetical protein
LAHETESSSSSQNSPEPRGLLYILLSAFAFLTGWSLAQLRTPNDDGSETIHPQHGTAPKDRLSRFDSMTAAQTPPTPTQPYQPDRRKDNTPPWKKRAEIAAIAVAIGLLAINIFLWRSTRDAAKAAKCSAPL